MNRIRKQELLDIVERFINSADFHQSYIKTFFGMGISVNDEIKELEKQRDFFSTWLKVNPSYDNAATTVELQANANHAAVSCRLSDILDKLEVCKAIKELNENKISFEKLL